MQKKIIALAVAGLVSGAAFAQSNVTVYGVADVGVVKQDSRKIAAAANSASNNGSSRLGFMGSEDLGGGMKANFAMEEQISLATGATGTSTVANAFTRQAWVGLSGGFGELQIGQNYTVGFTAQGKFETTGHANYSAVDHRFGSPGGNVALGSGVRNPAQVRYVSPNMGGMQIAFGHILKQNALDIGAVKAANELAGWYANGPIAVAFAYTQNPEDTKDKMIGGSFNFGMGRAVAGYYDPAGNGKGYSLGVADVKAGPVMLTFDYAKDTGSAGKPRTTLLEAKFPLSKRTFAYANYRDVSEANSDFWGLGIRHNF